MCSIYIFGSYCCIPLTTLKKNLPHQSGDTPYKITTWLQLELPNECDDLYQTILLWSTTIASLFFFTAIQSRLKTSNNNTCSASLMTCIYCMREADNSIKFKGHSKASGTKKLQVHQLSSPLLATVMLSGKGPSKTKPEEVPWALAQTHF